MPAPFPTEWIGERPALPEAFRRPLDVIRLEHERQARLCDRLEALAAESRSAPEAGCVEALLAYLSEDLAWHTEDEERDLFPMLRARCTPEDGIEEILDQLSREHDLDRDLAGFLIGDLEACAGRLTPLPPLRFFINARAFAETQRRHLGWENGLVLPLARKRLRPDDLDALGRNMAARRGIPYPG